MSDWSSHPLAELTQVSKTYLGPPPVTTLRIPALYIHRGDYIAITGPSGCGKSTLLNILGVLDRPTEGSYHFDGQDVGGMSERSRTALRSQRLGFVFQAFHLLAGRSAEANVALPLAYRRMKPRARREAARAALERVGLQHRIDAVPETMSGGERQRVAIARAVITEPDLLLCDEPTGNLDSRSTDEVLALLRSLHASGSTLVVVTHDERVASHALRRVRMLDGAIASNAGPDL